MNNYSITALYSGSKGNSVLIESEGTKILIDAGKSARALCNSLCEIGRSIDEIDAIFITHEHRDHISALEILLKKHKIPVHIVDISAKKLLLKGLSVYDDLICMHSPIFSVEIGDILIRRYGDSGHVEIVEGIECDISTGEIKFIRLTDERTPILYRRSVSVDDFNKMMYPIGDYRLGRYPNGSIRHLGRFEYATDIITEYGNNTYFKTGEDIWCYIQAGLTTVKIKNTETGIEQTATSLPTKNVIIESTTYTLYNIGQYITDNAEYHITTGACRCPCKLIRINQGSVTFDDANQKVIVSGNSENATPVWVDIFGKKSNDEQERITNSVFLGNEADIYAAYNGNYTKCKVYIFYQTDYGQAVKETGWHEIS